MGIGKILGGRFLAMMSSHLADIWYDLYKSAITLQIILRFLYA